jgi:hypothetical protein
MRDDLVELTRRIQENYLLKSDSKTMDIMGCRQATRYIQALSSYVKKGHLIDNNMSAVDHTYYYLRKDSETEKKEECGEKAFGEISSHENHEYLTRLM